MEFSTMNGWLAIDSLLALAISVQTHAFWGKTALWIMVMFGKISAFIVHLVFFFSLGNAVESVELTKCTPTLCAFVPMDLLD
jgi:hypothetical protein